MSSWKCNTKIIVKSGQQPFEANMGVDRGNNLTDAQFLKDAAVHPLQLDERESTESLLESLTGIVKVTCKSRGKEISGEIPFETVWFSMMRDPWVVNRHEMWKDIKVKNLSVKP